ncbi:Protein-S-isoprenylcysteine O-methyltransferase, partial [Trichinella pseudospiralis]
LTCHFLLKLYISDIFISCIVLFVIFVVLLLAPLPEICAVVIRSSFLAIAFFTGLCGCNSVHFENFHLFGWYLCVLSIFHFTEFIAIAVCSDDTLSIDSFLLNHSVEYWLAAILSWMEYFVEYYYFPSLKHVALISKCGFMLTITGEVIRKLAIYSAGKGFSHLVSTKRKETHKLVTTGVYHFWRHPAYLGWLLWSVGTQLILCNPACFVGYSYGKKLLECGCGVGNLIFPLLEYFPHLFIYACDFSLRAINYVKSNESFDEKKCFPFVCDLTKDSVKNLINETDVDMCTMIFLLSAIHPENIPAVLRNVFKVLKAGAVVFVRDYGLFDHAQLRFGRGKKMEENLYVRQDGTFAYFFSEDHTNEQI